MKHTAFFEIHRQLGAKMVEFGGYEMPVQYAGIIEEHKAVRRGVGLFDVSHMGEFEVRGRDAQALVQRVTVNDASKLSTGKAQYSAMCYPGGGIVDDLLVYRTGDSFLLVVNASNIPKDLAWIRSNAGGLDAEVVDRSGETSLLAVQGPHSLATLQPLTDAPLADLPYYSFLRASVAGVPMIVSRTGYTGELGFELYFDSAVETGEKVWHALMKAGSAYGIRPVGLGARDTLRLEMGYCLYGNDIDETTNPLEAGLGWITKLDKGDFIGRDELARVKRDGLKRKLSGFILEEPKGFPRHGYEIRHGGVALGHVTSGTISPVLEKGIGLGYVAADSSKPGSPVGVVIREKEVAARIARVPFVGKDTSGAS